MNRRSFLKRLGLGAALGTAGVLVGGEVDLDKLLWVPGEKTFFIPERPRIVHGLEAQRQYNYYQSQAVERIGLPPNGIMAGRSVRTAAGTVILDPYENAAALNGRVVGAKEAARLRLMLYNPRNRPPSDAQMNDMVSRVITERAAAGWGDPVGPDPWHFPVVMEKRIVSTEKQKIVIEGA